MKKWNSLAVAGIVALLVLGYGIPSVIMAIIMDMISLGWQNRCLMHIRPTLGRMLCCFWMKKEI